MISDHEPLLPPELERRIFEFVSPEDHKSIVLVARRAYEWIFPLKFHSLVITSEYKLSKFLNFMETKPTGYFAPHVNKLLLQTPTNLKAASTLLPAFPSLQWLAIWPIGIDAHVFDLILDLPKLKRLSLDGETRAFFEATRNKEAVLPNLTHLDLECLNVGHHPDENCIISLQSLTHLSYSIDEEIPEESLTVVLNGASALRVLVITDLQEDIFEDDSAYFESDFRVVLIRGTSAGSFIGDWSAHENGQPDFWDRAEDIIASRRPQAN